MQRLVLWSVLALCLSAASGCVFFDDDDDDVCRNYEATAGIQAYELRDPATGVCTGWGGGDCNDPCSVCALDGAGASQPYPDWAMCNASCEGLAESACLTTSGCRGAYNGSAFYQCWGVAPSGPLQGGACSGLDAYACSQHDDCVAIHAPGANGAPIGAFTSCAAEAGTGGPGSCVGEIDCFTGEPACPDGTIAGRRDGCWTGYCIPYAQCDALPACGELVESQCISRNDCSPIYEGQGCSCGGSGCSCTSWTFDSCKTM
jgi:hypothetical protein